MDSCCVKRKTYKGLKIEEAWSDPLDIWPHITKIICKKRFEGLSFEFSLLWLFLVFQNSLWNVFGICCAKSLKQNISCYGFFLQPSVPFLNCWTMFRVFSLSSLSSWTFIKDLLLKKKKFWWFIQHVSESEGDSQLIKNKTNKKQAVLA